MQAQRQLEEVKQQLSQSLIHSPRAARLKATPHRPGAPVTAASNSPATLGLTTPNPYNTINREEEEAVHTQPLKAGLLLRAVLRRSPSCGGGQDKCQSVRGETVHDIGHCSGHGLMFGTLYSTVACHNIGVCLQAELERGETKDKV